LILEEDITVIDDDENDKNEYIEDFIIAPNPTTDGRFTADVTLTQIANINITVYNFHNNIPIDSKQERGQDSYNIKFDISSQPSGLYIVSLETPYGNQIQKLIKK